jgi:hypothetical protein
MTPHEEQKRSLLEFAALLQAGSPALPEDATLMGKSIEALVAIVEWHDHATVAINELWAELSPRTREQLLKLGRVQTGGMTQLSSLVRTAGEIGTLAKDNSTTWRALHALSLQTAGRA